MGLSHLHLQTSYHKGRDRIAEDFYLPCMRQAFSYDRAVGYFRSTVFLIAWPALRDFVNRGGRIRVLCSQVLSADDIAALDRGYSARVDQKLAMRLREEVRSLLAAEELREPAGILAALVARGTLDLQVAMLRETELTKAHGRIFHDKLGLFRDSEGNVVMFKGSMNETWTGLSADGNLESVDVAASWMGARDLERVRTEESYFEELWLNRYPSLTVCPFPAVAREEFTRAASASWEADLDRIAERQTSSVENKRGRILHPHQSAGLASWVANQRKGILAFATGSGKTFTAITALREAVSERHQVPVIIVPDTVLFKQWLDEITATCADLQIAILRAGAGHSGWRSSLRAWTDPGPSRRLVLATVQTASSPDFRSRLSNGPHLFLIADEVHRLGSRNNRQLLNENLFGDRLGLSATPERAGDAEGTLALIQYFRGVLEPRYTLADAVRDRVLTPYFYRPHSVELSDDEATEWKKISREVRKLRGRIAGGDSSFGITERVQRLLIKRARVVKRAKAKVPLAVDVLKREFTPGQRWIVYCDDLEQLNVVCRSLNEAGYAPLPFHSQMEGDREETLKWLDRNGGIVVAIKCLDEGVDVPSVTHALILASSKNPREFVQRRGRVLRKAPGKALAFIHDAIVMAPKGSQDGDEGHADPVTHGEIARAVEFAQHAANAGAAADLQQIAIASGIEWRQLFTEGIEDGEE